MRIIGGRWRSHRLEAEGRSTRPTTDRARQVLFDIVGDRIAEAQVLDLYAGSGALGLEALSRGASFAIFVDQDARATAGIRRLVSELAAEELCEVWTRRVGSALGELRARDRAFDWIFADPPYDRGEENKVLARLGGDDGAILRAGGWLVLETPRQSAAPVTAGSLFLERTRDLGGSSLRFYRQEVSVADVREGSDG